MRNTRPAAISQGGSSPQSKGIEVARSTYIWSWSATTRKEDEPQGLYLSAETVSLQSQIGAALGTDVVVTAAQPLAL